MGCSTCTASMLIGKPQHKAGRSDAAKRGCEVATGLDIFTVSMLMCWQQPPVNYLIRTACPPCTACSNRFCTMVRSWFFGSVCPGAFRPQGAVEKLTGGDSSVSTRYGGTEVQGYQPRASSSSGSQVSTLAASALFLKPNKFQDKLF